MPKISKINTKYQAASGPTRPGPVCGRAVPVRPIRGPVRGPRLGLGGAGPAGLGILYLSSISCISWYIPGLFVMHVLAYVWYILGIFYCILYGILNLF